RPPSPWYPFSTVLPSAPPPSPPPTPSISEAANTPPAHGDFLFFITSLPPEAQASGSLSDLCAVGYYMSYWRDVGSYGGYSAADFGYAPTYKLHRYFKSSNDTWKNTISSNVGLYPYLQSPASNPLFDTPLGLANGKDEVIARNVVNFRLIPIYEASSGSTVQYAPPPTAPTPSTGSSPTPAAGAPRTSAPSPWKSS
ncbi:MAG: hypothetical protein HC901_00780, partial [Bdellovibrionaceae bacterium]|nr:hypothetical protein [Pseudobdellovibrionaceae bacterium]